MDTFEGKGNLTANLEVFNNELWVKVTVRHTVAHLPYMSKQPSSAEKRPRSKSPDRPNNELLTGSDVIGVPNTPDDVCATLTLWSLMSLLNLSFQGIMEGSYGPLRANHRYASVGP